MKFKLIACINERNVIGRNGGLLYSIKNDLKNFKRMTTNNVVIMGRKTFESLPNKSPLPNRINIIVTSDDNFNVDKNDNVFIVHSINEVIDLCNAFFSNKELFVIGGGNLYNQFLDLNLVNEALITKVNDDSFEEGDVTINTPWDSDDKWKVYYESYAQRQRCDDNDISYKFIIYKKYDEN